MSKHVSSVLTLVLAALIMLFIFFLPPIQTADLNSRDLLFELRGPLDLSHSDIVIVEISSRADDEIPYKYPWPTNVYAKLVENLNKAGAKAIAFDILFDQQDLYNPRNDTLFANAVEEAGNVLFSGRVRQEPERRFLGGFVADQRTPSFPRQIFLNATPWNIGFVDMRPDLDGFIRSYPFQYNYINDTYYSLALQILPLINGEETVLQNRDEVYEAADRLIPKTERSRMIINYYGGYRSFDYVSFEAVIDDSEFETTTEREAFDINEFDDPDYGLLYKDILKDKIVLVGTTMPELQDFHSVPYPDRSGEYAMAGVEIHAHALQTILDGRFLTEVGVLNSLLITLLLLCVSYLITSRFVGWSGLTMTLLIGIVWAITAFMFFNYASLFIPIVPVLLAVVVGYIGSVTHNVIYEEREKKKIKSMFSSYVSPELVDKMISDEFDYTLGGREDELTVMFSDIENFTTLSESLSPRELVSMINSYLNTFTEVINEENGTLDKYIGDAVMAIYGAPVPIENQAACACRTVLKTEQKWEKQSYDLMGVQIRTRYGINTGPMLVGNMGSERRFNYTVMGDQVNLAARCESACKIFGVYSIVSESTKIQAEKTNEFVFRKLGKVRVKGRNKSVVLYQLVGFTDQYDLSVLNLIKQFESALDLYFDRKFSEALSIFEKLTSKEVANFHVNKNLNPSLFYAGLCRELIENTPENDWNGVIER
ncbi:CHASE2 domain-containing protein [Rhodohalobacter barkolensis]|uniref:Guanylate cyclase domain-containing protein n=1 Tax=Rhodohalobacter barkolensis TaxID=2053187 RepID=A0A2N0VFZ3_9BACT|nr:adenylate/guanylate cyclase domain-containing protein [Rhodohalobacter barkolensis]PKD43112.1 hypothetical protein CWD77_10815 [Rhodohalobacter barkolensis]